ncbi:MAG: hypothetical protein HYS08_04325 [Chlamydiae bacterium]|nr:hypothetical protein [Chlamydiota bacterium]MBI3266144.1 hypothetical protein [Chlamydiota bacterium]
MAMFEVDLSTAFLIYLILSLSGLFFAWIYYEYRKKARNFSPIEKVIYRCKICAHSYIVERDETLSKCPQCGSFNDANEEVKTG